jgi:hypothetical protein
MDTRLIFASLVACLLVPPLAQAITVHYGAGDVSCLIAAMNTANTPGQANRLILAAGMSLLTAVDHDDEAPMGLPTAFGILMIQGAGMGQTVLLAGAVARGPLRGVSANLLYGFEQFMDHEPASRGVQLSSLAAWPHGGIGRR